VQHKRKNMPPTPPGTPTPTPTPKDCDRSTISPLYSEINMRVIYAEEDCHLVLDDDYYDCYTCEVFQDGKLYCFPIDRCRIGKNGLTNDPSPKDRKLPEWFNRDIDKVSSFVGGNIPHMICSVSPIVRMFGYRAIGDYHGYMNLDSYPIEMTLKEWEARYDNEE
jgi:hypothetical protein